MDLPPSLPENPKKRLRMSAVQRERLRLSQVLHNTVCQELTGVCFLAGAAAHQHGAADPDAGRKFEEIAELVQRVGASLAAIVHDLNRPL